MLAEDYKREIAFYRDRILFYEKAAERVIGLMGLFQGIYFAGISFSKLKEIQGGLHLPFWMARCIMDIFLLPFAFFLLSLFFAMRVILTPPERDISDEAEEKEQRSVPKRSAPDNEERRKRVNKWKHYHDKKYRSLRNSYVSMGLAFLFLFIAMGVYLVYLPGVK